MIGLSVAEVAEVVGCDEAQVRRWELGNASPSARNLRRLASALTCSIDGLVPRPDHDGNVMADP